MQHQISLLLEVLCPHLVACSELAQQMPSFELNLAGGHLYRLGWRMYRDLAAVETVAAGCCFDCNFVQVCRYRASRVTRCPETLQLGVVHVSFGLPAENLLREQPFPPQSQEALPVKVLRVNRPESHRDLLQLSCVKRISVQSIR